MFILEANWPWWFGAFALATTCVGYYVLIGRPCGTSGSWWRILNWKAEADAVRTEQRYAANKEAADRELLERTRAMIESEDLPEEVRAQLLAEADKDEAAAATEAPANPRPLPSAELCFLIGLGLGGLASAVFLGRFEFQFTLGETHTALWGDGVLPWAILFVGGLSAGFGVRMAGGCTMGHGLSGCSSLQPGSLLATACFFGTAVGVSLLLGVLL